MNEWQVCVCVCVCVLVSEPVFMTGDTASLHDMLASLSDPGPSSDISNWNHAGSVSLIPVPESDCSLLPLSPGIS